MPFKRPGDLDDTLIRIGGFGRWQRVQWVIASVSLVFFWASNFFFVIASYSNIDMNCDLYCKPNNSFSSGVEPGSCQEDHTYMKFTTVNEWNLICDDSWLRSIVQAAFFVGQAIGLFLSYTIGEFIGPRKLLCLSSVVFVVCTCVSPYSVFYWIFVALRLGVGVTTGVAFGSIYTIAFDTSASRFIPVLCCSLILARILAHYLLIGFAYVTQSWNLVNLIISAPVFVLAALNIWLMPESPRWYLAKKKTTDAERILSKIARCNGYKPEHISILVLGIEANVNDIKCSILDVFSDSGDLFKRILTLSLANIFHAIAYYVLSFSPAFYHKLAGWTLYWNLGLCGLLELVAMLAAAAISFFNVPRRCPTLTAAVAAGMLCMLGSAVCDSALATMVLMFSSKLLITISDVLLQVMTAEAFPRKMSTGAFLVILSLAHLGAVAAPYLVISLEQDAMIPMLICGVFAVCASFAIFMAPETIRKDDDSTTSHKPYPVDLEMTDAGQPLIVQVQFSTAKPVYV
uniref:Major facilitator superfamily (MFS) profile domain-containing protein n=1 Tax=Plectus sambesii TaxID=2011161 RepID=A0A914XC26_9BILA